MNLLFAINHNFTELLCGCLTSVLKNGDFDHYSVYILHSDLTAEDQNAIRQTAGGRVELHFLPIDERMFDGFPETNRYPKQIYYRLAAPLLLPEELDRILYLDVDLVVINSLRELYHTDFEGNYYVACSHVGSSLTRLNQLRLGIQEDVPYINTGVMVMNLPLLRQNLSLEQIRLTAMEKMRSFILPDQDILTVMHGEHIKLVDTMRYNLSDRLIRLNNADPRNEKIDLQWVRDHAAILHFYGKNKPWKKHYTGILDGLYWEHTMK